MPLRRNVEAQGLSSKLNNGWDRQEEREKTLKLLNKATLSHNGVASRP